MVDEFVISENIEILVFGSCNIQFIEKVLLNSGFRESSLMNTLIKQNKEFLNNFLVEAASLSSGGNATVSGKQNTCTAQNLSSQNIPQASSSQTKTKNSQKTYFKNISKLLKLNESVNEEEVQEKCVENEKNETGQLESLEKGLTFLNWADFKRITSTISTKNFWINFNFNLVSEMFLDPYINNFVTANINLLVLTFDLSNDVEIKKMAELFKKLATSKPPSNIKYQSQMLLLQSGYYQAFNDNIVLALCELPEIEAIGPCFLAGFGDEDIEKVRGIVGEVEEKSSKIEKMNDRVRNKKLKKYILLIKNIENYIKIGNL